MSENRMQEIRKQFCEKIHVESIDDGKTLKDLGVDSLDVVEMCLDLEDRYGFQFTADELSAFQTVGDLFRSIEQKLQEKGA